jgi:glucose/arabinose dehydrogenase
MKQSSGLKNQRSNCRRGYIIAVLIGLATLVVGINAIAAPRIVIEPLVSGLRYPVDINHAADGSERLFVIEQEGRIKIIKNGTLQSIPFLDIINRVECCGERGLLGVAFHPAYNTNGFFYVNYTSKQRAGVAELGDTIIARYEVSSENPEVADPDSESILLVVAQPFSNHNAGKLLFSPIDGYLYIPLGDGGSGGDPGNRAQNPLTLLGKILRIDVDSASPYAIPPDNPFVDSTETLEEIWALGLRNPWRFSFDRETGDMYIGDVGQSTWEEIDYQAAASPGGVNFGWRCREGAHNFNFSTECAALELTDPIAEYGRDLGYSVTGGFVYRGAKYPALFGQYFYADYGTGRIWTTHKLDSENWSSPELELDTSFKISTFGEDESGELYFAHRALSDGTIYQIIDVCEGDTDDDGEVDGFDLADVAADFVATACNGDCPNDLNGDGMVDNKDIKVLADDFGRTDCPPF